jgi:hypothetical protein
VWYPSSFSECSVPLTYLAYLVLALSYPIYLSPRISSNSCPRVPGILGPKISRLTRTAEQIHMISPLHFSIKKSLIFNLVCSTVMGLFKFVEIFCHGPSWFFSYRGKMISSVKLFMGLSRVSSWFTGNTFLHVSYYKNFLCLVFLSDLQATYLFTRITTRTECILPVFPLKNDLNTTSGTSRHSRQYICCEWHIYFTLF